MPNYLREILLDLALLIWLHHASVFVSCRPLDTVAVVNQSTIFNCSTLVPKIVWYYYPVGSDETQSGDIIYRSGTVYPKYIIDFQVDSYNIGETHFCNLIINTVKESFAGKYECRDKDGAGAVKYAQMIVIDSNPVCRPDSEPVRAIGLNDCGLEPEQVKLTCGVSFIGNSPPILKWTADVNHKQVVLNDTHKIANNQMTSDVTLNTGNYIHDTKIKCHAVQSIDKEQFCTFDIRILYAMNTTIRIDKVVGDEVNCSVNTNSHSCHYEWIKPDDKDSSTVSNSSVLKIKNSGLHQCRATCDLLDKKCIIFGTSVNASASAIDKNPNDGHTGAIVGIVIVAVLVIVAVIGILYIRRKRSEVRGSGSSYAVPIKETSETLLLNSNVEQQQPVSFQSASTRPEPTGEHARLSENTVYGKEISYTAPKEETSETLLSNSDVEKRPMSFPSASTRPEPADEGRRRKRKRNGDEESADVDVERGSPENSLHPPPVASGNHHESLLVDVTPEFHRTGLNHTLKAQDPNNSEKGIAGVAVCKEELFVVFEGSSTVEVFHASTFAFEDSFIVNNLDKPLDIASCPAEDRFFIYSLGKDSSGEIFVIDRNGSLLLSWQTGESVGCLSVTFDSSVILSVRSRCLLKVYSTNGVHIKDVKFSSNIQPFHALRVTEDEFIISYEEKNLKIHGLCLVNSNGGLIRNISEPLAFPGSLSLASPKYLSLTSDGECLIADSRNSRILLLKQTFEVVNVLSAEDGLTRPARIYFDYSNGRRLFVADNGVTDNGDRNPRVMIFEFSHNDC